MGRVWTSFGGLFIGLAMLVPAAASAEGAGFRWPNGARAAVSLAYDDAAPSQLDNAIPALDRHGLKGSFYLTLAADSVRTRMDEWRAAARNGHELGNHTLFHQCSAKGPGRTWVAPAQDLDRTSAAQMQAQVELANTMLRAIDGSTEFTFTAPCGDRIAADGDYIARVRDLFVGVKLGWGAVVPDMHTLDRGAVPVVTPSGVSGAELIAMVEEAGRRGTMVNFTFHGIGGDHLSVSNEAHEALLAYLARHRDRYWTATFREQMRWVRDHEALPE
jgi:peptidoglycan/xylan/chitin deacetylase (PgdA/CDA1 family)